MNNDLNTALSENIKKAVTAAAAHDYDGAYKLILKARECALLLAKKSDGKKKEQYLKKDAELKAMLSDIEAKKQKIYASSVAPTDAPHKKRVCDNVGDKKENTSSRPVPYTNAKRSDGGDALSPKWLKDYIGQPQAVTAVKDLINAARLKNSALPHLILYGSQGLGKTTFAKIIANELGVGFTEVPVSKITETEMVSVLKNIKPRDVVFIDEIHTLPQNVAESVLYSAMQDGRVTYMEGKGKFARTQTLEVPPFTLIGATTEIGKLPKPFIQRTIQIRLVEYTDEVLSGIILNSFYRLGMKINAETALHIAKRCRNNPRVANLMVRRISDKALVRYAALNNIKTVGSFDSVDAVKKLNIEISRQIADEFFADNEIDEYGLERSDRELLRVIIERYNGGPVGLDTLASVMNESVNVITKKYEAYLIKRGMVKIERDGRVVLPPAYKALGLAVPQSATDKAENSSGSSADDGKTDGGDIEPRKIIASRVSDMNKCAKIESLIVYPSNAIRTDASLDELFPDIVKDYDAQTKHFCSLEIDFDGFKRTLLCDSFLESRFASYMATAGYIKDIKAQALELPYVSQAMSDRRYFPDLFIKDNKNRIAVIEMKNIETVSYHLNIDKYDALKAYCEKNGFGYAEIMKNGNSYVSVETLKNASVDRELERHITDAIRSAGEATGEGVFTAADFDKYAALHTGVTLTDVYTVLLNNRELKNTDRNGTGLRIVLSESVDI